MAALDLGWPTNNGARRNHRTKKATGPGGVSLSPDGKQISPPTLPHARSHAHHDNHHHNPTSLTAIQHFS
ncbi:hypothetical protein J6590_044375 [Homalodisca vitripennis]|nr:hypothetical protein J6590_044375 [Homalodisca vitripennis]